MKIQDLVGNVLLMRQQWLQQMLDPRRDIDKECGHPLFISIQDYKRSFLRGDLASRIVSIYPEESWRKDPVVYETDDEKETEFEAAWNELQLKQRIFSMLQRADVLSGIGRFGVVLLGMDDGLDLRMPIEGVNEQGEKEGKAEHKLLYLRPFDESLVTVHSLEQDVSNPRYGLPTAYEIHFVDTTLGDVDSKSTSTARIVHWSRAVHLTDNRTNSEVFGAPRMEKVFDRLLDLKKIMGGSGEMFWKGGFPGLSIEAAPGLEENIEFDATATAEQMEAYQNGLQRYIALVGMQAKSLAVQVADPRSHVETQVRMIAMAIGVPWRILMGVEVGQLASEQDIEAWNGRVTRRQNEYITPFILTPFIDRLIAIGALPEPKEYTVEWSDLNAPKDEDLATVAEKRTNALAKYVSGGVDTLVPPFHYLTLILKMSDEEAEAIIDAAEKQQDNDGEGLDLHPNAEPAEGEEVNDDEPVEGDVTDDISANR